MRKPIHLLLLGSLVVAFASRVEAANISVAAGEVVVNTGNGACSLREAIRNANLPAGGDASGGDCTPGAAGADTIILRAGSTYTLPNADSGIAPGNSPSGITDVTSDVTIQGNGAVIERDAALFSGADPCNTSTRFRIFAVDGSGAILRLQNVTVRNGCAENGGAIFVASDVSLQVTDSTITANGADVTFAGAGGAIFNCGTTTVTNSSIESNHSRLSGGGIQNDGTLTLTDSTVAGNDVSTGAGGGITSTGTLTVTRSTISGNDATSASGGGVYNGSSSATVTNSTLSGNQAAGTGGGFQNNQTVTLTNATVSNNTAMNPGNNGAGIFNDDDAFGTQTATLSNTIVGAQGSGTDCGGTGFSSSGDNIDSDGTCGLGMSDLPNTNPKLDPLGNNGGPTQTQALQPGSPALDASSSCVQAVDQRGVSRPQPAGGMCDIGAFEAENLVSGAPALSHTVLVLLFFALGTVGCIGVRRARA